MSVVASTLRSMDRDVTFHGTAAAVVALLASARADGVIINRTKLAKLLYLADLYAVEQGLPAGTSVEWRWRHYGPYSDTLLRVEQDLERAGVIDVQRTETFYGSREQRLRLAGISPRAHIDEEFAGIIDRMVLDYGSLSASQLRELTYQSEPMRRAQADGTREARLDLAGGPPLPDLAPGLRKLRRLARDMPLPDDEPGAMDDLTDEIEEWGPLRDEATGHLLDSQ